MKPVLLLLLCLSLAHCTRKVSEAECARFRDRLRTFAEQRGHVDAQASDDFMRNCAGATLPQRTIQCLEQAQDERTFFRCLD